MAEKKLIPSVNQGIRSAVEDFVNAHKLREYQRGMEEAAADPAFIKRTLETQQAFAVADGDMEVTEEW
jgi:hypothetical protein